MTHSRDNGSDYTDGDGAGDTGFDFAATDIPADDANSGGFATPLTTRARAQQRLTDSRQSIQDLTARARNSARRSPAPALAADGEDATQAATTTSERIRAYRAHLISAAAAAVVLLVVVLRRRADNHTDDQTIDLGDWRLHAEPIDNDN